MKRTNKKATVQVDSKMEAFFAEVSETIVKVANEGSFANKSVDEVAQMVNSITAAIKNKHGIEG